jgi:hypothetical protein
MIQRPQPSTSSVDAVETPGFPLALRASGMTLIAAVG